MTEKRIHKAYLLMALSLDLAPLEKIFENSRFLTSDHSWQDVIKQDTLLISDAIKLVENIEKHAKTPDYAAIFGAHLGAASHGPVGYATLSAATVGDALRTFLQWFYLRCDAYKARITSIETFVEVTIEDTSNNDVFKAFFFEAMARALEVIIIFLVGQAPENSMLIYFESQAANKQQLLEQHFHAKLVFGSSQNKLLIPKQVWYKKSPLHDQTSYEFNIEQCKKLQATLNDKTSMESLVKQVIKQHINDIINKNKEGSPISQVHASKLLNIHERTLIRRLKQCDTSFKQLLEIERKEFSRTLLSLPKYTVYDVANILGYAESANFCRAFKRWYHCTPTEFRRRGKK